jgi:hypothetical protein
LKPALGIEVPHSPPKHASPIVHGKTRTAERIDGKGSTSRDPASIYDWHEIELICIKTFDQCLRRNVDNIFAVQSDIWGRTQRKRAGGFNLVRFELLVQIAGLDQEEA